MYSKESLCKLINLMNVAQLNYEKKKIQEIKMAISSGNRKIGRVMNVSLPPILTCGKRCSGCIGICYDIKACLQYPNTVIDARIRNYVILQKSRDEFFGRVDEAMSRRRKNKFFRWHVAGDIVDLDYFSRMVYIAQKHPDFVIWTYTKQYEIVNEYCDKFGRDSIPDNFTIMFSEWRGIEMINPYHFPEFRVVFKDDEVKPVGFYCPGNCDICKENHRGCVAQETVYCNEH